MFENCNLSHIFQPNSRTYRKVASEMLQQRTTLIQLTSNVQAIRLIITFSWRDFFSFIVPYKNRFRKNSVGVFRSCQRQIPAHLSDHRCVCETKTDNENTQKVNHWRKKQKTHSFYLFAVKTQKKKLDNSFEFYFQLKNDIDKDK